jgi:PAS domain-containing protein
VKYDRLIHLLRENSRLQIAVVKMLPLNLILLMGALIAPWRLDDMTQTTHVFAMTLSLLAIVCLLGWSIVCVMERSSSAGRDLLSFVLYMIAIGGMRHMADTGQFLGYTSLFMVGVLWMSIFSSPRAFTVAWALSALALFGPTFVWVEHYAAAYKGYSFIFAVTSVISWSVLVALRVIRSQIAESTTARRLHDAILEGAGECYVCVDDRGTILEYNASAEVVFERPASEVIGAPLVLILAQAPSLPGPGQTDRISQDVEGIRGDGSRFALQCFAGRVELGSRTLHPLFMHDVSIRQRRDAMRAAQHEVTALMSTNPSAGKFVRRALRLIGSNVGWDGMTLLSRSGDCYRVREHWEKDPQPQELSDEIERTEAPCDEPYWDRLRQSGTDCSLLDADLPDPARTLGKMGAACIGSATTPDGRYVLQCWAQDASNMARDDLSRSDYLGGLQLMLGQIVQYLARHAAESQLRSVQAMELNDDVVQALFISSMYRSQGDDKRADEYVSRALTASKRFITRLAVHAGDVEPGGLVRGAVSPKTENAPFEGGESL